MPTRLTNLPAAIALDADDQIYVVEDGNSRKASTEAVVKAGSNATGTAPVYACRAWVNFIGTGTVSIRASGNVSSITDNGTGNYTVNFTIPMPDANYSVNATTFYRGSGAIECASITNPSAGAVQILTGEIATGSAVDVPGVFVSVFR